MIPAAFDYVLPESADEAIAALVEHGDEAKLLAGGHSLIPLMRFRLATPAYLIDIGRLDDLKYVRDAGDHLAIGALTRHRDVEISDLVQRECGLLADVTANVGDNQVRHRGTIGGAIAHGDAASDIPAALLALRATLIARGPDGEREIAIDDFFSGFLETALDATELLAEVRVPKVPDAGWSFQKINRRAQDWAIVAAAVLLDGDAVGVGLVNMGPTPLRASAVESAIAAGADATAAAEVAADGTEAPSDLNASARYREHLARVLVRRAVEDAQTRRNEER